MRGAGLGRLAAILLGLGALARSDPRRKAGDDSAARAQRAVACYDGITLGPGPPE